MSDMLTLSTHLPLIEMDAGEAVVTEGGASGSVWILLEGALQVLKGDVAVNTITQPGAIVGEMSVLLGTSHGATVRKSVAAMSEVARPLCAIKFGQRA